MMQRGTPPLRTHLLPAPLPRMAQVGAKSVYDIAEELALLQLLAAANRLPAEALSGGTATISNIGTLGGTYATPLVNPPEALIVALGRAVVVPRFAQPIDPAHLHMYAGGCRAGGAAVARAPQVVPRAVMPVSWGADHRVLDGAALAALNATWKQLLEAPARMLLRMR